MSIQTQIDRINQNIANTYAVLRSLGADVPADQTSDNLAGTAETVSSAPKGLLDEIRYKTGISDSLTPDQMLIDIAMLPPLSIGDVPGYVRTEAERVAGLAKALQNEYTITTIHATDVHVGTDDQGRATALHLAQAIHLIKKQVTVDGTFLHGDIVTGAASDTLDVHLDNHMYSRRTLAIADSECEMDGNHDANIYNAASYMNADDLYRYVGRRNVNAEKPSTETDRNYFYLDTRKTRFICLNTADLKDIPASAPQDGHHISKYQFRWLVDALGTAKADGMDNIIVLGHHPLHWYGSMPNVLTILDGYIAGGSGSITSDGETISFNFAGKNGAKILGTVHGHTHNLIHGKVGNNKIIRLGTPNGCFGRNNEYGMEAYGDDFRQKYGEVKVADDGTLERVVYAKTANSAKDTAFTVNVWDLEQQVVNSICYGAGYDRMMTWQDVVMYTISNKLTNITTSNNTLAVEQGASYTATLTAADGYYIKTVVITMGGVDITATAYADGVISIPEVTGNVVITAVTNNPVVNLVPTSVDIESDAVYNGVGYKNGVYVSSGVSYGTDAACTTTGLIPYEIPAVGLSDPLYISGVTVKTGNSHERVRIFKAYDKSNVTMWYANEANFSSYWVLEQLGEKYYKLTPAASGNTSNMYQSSGLRDINYFLQFTFVGKGEDLVISWQEQDDASGGGGDAGSGDSGGDSGGDAGGGEMVGDIDIAAIGYTDNARWSASDGTIRTGNTGYTAINEIPFTRASGDTLVIELKGGVHWSYDGSKCVLVLMKNGAFAAATYLNTNQDSANTGYRTIVHGDGSVTVELYDAAQTNYQGVNGIKVSGYGKGADAAIAISYK